MTFQPHNLHPVIARNLERIGYREPKPIQELAIPAILAGRDVIGLAKTGTGKTAAFIVPIAHQLISSKPPRSARNRPIDPMTRLRALILCPTRELAQQVADEAASIMQGSVLRVAAAYGKVAISPQAQAIARGLDILVATPGRARELLENESLSLAHIKHVVIDEADRMLDMGFLPQVQELLARVPEPRQMLLFTATMPGEVEDLARQFLREPQRIESEPHTTPVEHVQQHLLPVDDDDKVALLLHMLKEKKRRGVLIFCRTKRRVGWVGTALGRNEISVGMLHGDMSQAQRNKSLERFTDRDLRVLVATDVAARGLHVPAVKTVINYDLPNTPEEYVHRIGRAAHGGGSGEAFTLLADDQQEKLRWRALMDRLNIKVFAEELPGFAPPGKPTRRRETPDRGDGRRGRRDAGADRGDDRIARGDDRGQRGAAPVEADERPTSKRAVRRVGRPQRRSRKGRPIKKGQKPGKGVIRPQ